MTAETIRSIQGTEDVMPWQWGHWRKLCSSARRLFELYGYGELRTPVIEDARLFVKGTGETTDVVEKEMYTIPTGGMSQDADTRWGIALRPEGTPPAVRSYLEHGLHNQLPFRKLYYVGPMFRHERPQRGRLRQFHHLGVEAIGSPSPLLDAETILLAVALLRDVGLKHFRVWVNTIGCCDCRPAFREGLLSVLRRHAENLCEDCRGRMDRNVLRVYDCKNAACRDIVESLPTMAEHACGACATHHGAVLAALRSAGVECAEDPRLVRGLDYYTRTVYEIKHPALGARDTVCGGGRYDGLVELLGGPAMPCVGFAVGAEPTILAMQAELGEPEDTTPRPAVYVVCFDERARSTCFELAQELRAAGLATDLDYESRSAKAQMRAANRAGAAICALIGERELQSNEVLVKDMAEGGQQSVARGTAVAAIRRRLGMPGAGEAC
jgi:histidyl-tRNA synthetase